GGGTDGAAQARRHADSMSGPWPDREHDTRCGLPHGDGGTYTLRKDIPMTTLTSDHQTIRSLSQTPSPALPLTGAEYLDSLRDDREIWIYGERVKDVTTHPAFRNSARSVARLYDALHDPAHRAVLTTETDAGNGGFTHPFYKAPHGRAALVAARDAIACSQGLPYGYIG